MAVPKCCGAVAMKEQLRPSQTFQTHERTAALNLEQTFINSLHCPLDRDSRVETKNTFSEGEMHIRQSSRCRDSGNDRHSNTASSSNSR